MTPPLLRKHCFSTSNRVGNVTKEVPVPIQKEIEDMPLLTKEQKGGNAQHGRSGKGVETRMRRLLFNSGGGTASLNLGVDVHEEVNLTVLY